MSLRCISRSQVSFLDHPADFEHIAVMAAVSGDPPWHFGSDSRIDILRLFVSTRLDDRKDLPHPGSATGRARAHCQQQTAVDGHPARDPIDEPSAARRGKCPAAWLIALLERGNSRRTRSRIFRDASRGRKRADRPPSSGSSRTEKDGNTSRSLGDSGKAQPATILSSSFALDQGCPELDRAF